MLIDRSLCIPDPSQPALCLTDAKVEISPPTGTHFWGQWFARDTEKENVSVLNGVNLTVPAGAWYMLVGPSGCGKSTLLSVLNNLTPLSSGQALKFGVPVDCWGRKWECCPGTRTGTVFQTPALFDQLTALENVCMGFECREKCTTQEKHDKALLVMEALDVARFALRFPSELSGGQQQRISIARALVGDPDLLLMDEPLSALDEANARIVNRLLLERQQAGTTILMASHRLGECLEACSAKVEMDAGVVTSVDVCNFLPKDSPSSAPRDLPQDLPQTVEMSKSDALKPTRNASVWN
ncbi:ATP-binding cassette domain-containing protein [Enterovibrio makurazakiensis]|uniref:ATP-binding cassette domain-containing protein n=1 Tax=Enterovibrio makurazakiensis TaxID=2910232 RepID=UPI003D25F70E